MVAVGGLAEVVDDPLYTLADSYDVEVDEEPERYASELEIREELCGNGLAGTHRRT